MPPRWMCLLIVVFWLATTGWLVHDDLLPRLLPGTPPSYTIDLVEEAKVDRNLFTPWTVYLDDARVMQARTRVEHPHRDTFVLSAEFSPDKRGSLVPLGPFLVRRMVSRYHVNATGDLLGLSVEIDGRANIELLKLFETDFRLTIDGDVAGGHLAPALSLETTSFRRGLRLPEVSVPRGGAVLLPLHPVNRIRGLTPGRAWTMRAFDPVADSLRALQGSDSEPRLLRARVRPQVEEFSHARRIDEPCFVIDYTGEGLTAATWVSVRTGLVLLQEATLGKAHWAMYRDR